MTLATGTTLGTYEILAALGEGGMGEVYLVHDARLGRKIALKVLRHDARSDDRAKRRFGKEAQMASALKHPNIVTIFDVGHTDGLDFIAMEYVEGRIRTRLVRPKPLPWTLVAASGAVLANARSSNRKSDSATRKFGRTCDSGLIAGLCTSAHTIPQCTPERRIDSSPSLRRPRLFREIEVGREDLATL
jgi:hypothetical protein